MLLLLLLMTCFHISLTMWCDWHILIEYIIWYAGFQQCLYPMCYHDHGV